MEQMTFKAFGTAMPREGLSPNSAFAIHPMLMRGGTLAQSSGTDSYIYKWPWTAMSAYAQLSLNMNNIAKVQP